MSISAGRILFALIFCSYHSDLSLCKHRSVNIACIAYHIDIVHFIIIGNDLLFCLVLAILTMLSFIGS